MLIAQQKLKENIAEYILYMYQVEDIIRAYQFDLERLMEEYVQKTIPNASFTPTYKKWYSDLIQKMQSQKIEKAGHLNELKEILLEISYLHNTLLNLTGDHKYKDLFERANTFIDEFKEKSNLKDKNQVEIAFHALYMKLLLRIQGKEISAESEEAFDAMRMMLAYLSKSFGQMKEGNMDFLKN